MLKNRIAGHILVEDVIDTMTKQNHREKGTEATRENWRIPIQNAAVPFVWIQTEERNVKVLHKHDGRYYELCRCRSPEVGLPNSCIIRYRRVSWRRK